MSRFFRVAELSRRALVRALAVFILAIAAFAVASPAQAAPRATLSWDTDKTDVDLHIWDAFGNHAWYGSQTGVPAGQLSTDIIFGFGPERFEEFAGLEGDTYTYGICYFGSNTGDNTVPETVATVDIVDPDGRTRTVTRTLRTEKEAYYLGSSPAGGGFQPADDWCSAGPYHPATDAGPADTPVAGGATFEGCPRIRRRLGVVELCANTFSGLGPVYTATGNVRVNGSVYLGEGPVTVDVNDGSIRAPSGTLQVIRGAQAFPIADGLIEIDTKPTTDPVSGRDQVASIQVSNVGVALPGMRAGGLPISVSDLSGGVLKLFLDRRDGGGVIAQANIQLPFSDHPSGNALAIGIHGASSSAVRALGGAAQFGDVMLPGGWGLNAFMIAYQENGDAWQASGGLKTPFFGLDVEGSIADGQLNSVGVTVSKDVPIGTTGFILSKVGGKVEGLATPPLKISASVEGRWGSVPGVASLGVLNFNPVSLVVDLSGSATLKGDVTFLKRKPSPIEGSIDIGFGISPFAASGHLDAHANVGPLNVTAGGGVAMRPDAFTAAGGASGSIRGVKLGSARGVLSDKGLGVTGRICVFHTCSDLGAGMNWNDFPSVRYIGGDVDQFVTASAVGTGAATSRSGRSIVVRRGRPFLFIDADGPDGTLPSFRVRSPNGSTYTTLHAKPDSRISSDRSIGYVGLTIAAPRPGRWRVTPLGSSKHATRFVSQTVRTMKRVRVTRVTPTGTRAKPISRRGGTLKVGWTSRGLSPKARVAVYVTPNAGQLGHFIVGGKSARNGLVQIPRKLLAKGTNRVRLVVTDGGLALDDVIARQVIRAK